MLDRLFAKMTEEERAELGRIKTQIDELHKQSDKLATQVVDRMFSKSPERVGNARSVV